MSIIWIIPSLTDSQSQSGRNRQTKLDLLYQGKMIRKHGLDFKTLEESQQWLACTKNFGHSSFIPVKDFTTDHLPTEYRDHDVVDYIRALADLTVRITVKYVSQERPKDDTLYYVRGKQFGRTGSGIVKSINMSDGPDQECHCRECKQSKCPQVLAASIVVQTARHVVFDQTEVDSTVIDFFYDDDVDIQNVRRLPGSKIIRESKDQDLCIFECVTCDRNLAKKLTARLDTFNKQNTNLKTKLMNCKTQLAVIASHPHGCYKHITVGEWTMPKDVLVRAAPSRRYSAPVGGTFVNCDKIFFTIPVHADPLFVRGQPEEAEMAGIEVLVVLPDGTESKRLIWHMDRPSKETKQWLLHDGGVHIPPETLDMIMELPNGEQQKFEDETIINYYYEDLTMALRVYFIERNL